MLAELNQHVPLLKQQANEKPVEVNLTKNFGAQVLPKKKKRPRTQAKIGSVGAYLQSLWASAAGRKEHPLNVKGLAQAEQNDTLYVLSKY